MLVRLRFVGAPLTDDEGALLTAAQVWTRGGVPYRDVWFDGPQGVLVLYRLWTPGSVRWLGVFAAVFLVIAVASVASSIARTLAVRRSDLVPSPDRTAAIAALVTAVVAVSPGWLGFAAAPVLIGLTFAMAALALSIHATAGRLGGWAGIVAGVWCGAAVSLDLAAARVALMVPLWLALAAVGRRHRRNAVATLRLVGVGALVVVAPLAMHAVRLGVSPWWDAVVVARSHRDDPQQWLLLVPVLAIVAGLVIGRLQRASWRAAAVAVVLVPTAWSFGAQVFRPDSRIATGGTGNGAAHAESVGRWIAANSDPGDRVLALCSGAATYAYAERDPALPYLDAADLRQAAPSPMLVASVLSGDDRPEWVAVFDLPAECGSPTLVGVLADFYVEETVIEGVRLLRAVGS